MNIVGFGDFLIHFSPQNNERFLQANTMELSYTGAEANVCAALAYWNENVKFITKLPDNILSTKGVMFLNSFGIKTENIEYGEGRMGLYFLEKGHAVRPSSVIYDRFNSVFTNSKFEDYSWDEILNDADAFYLSGITPSLSNSLFECCKKVLKQANEKDIPVFYDVNLRPSICNIEKSREIFNALSPYITHLISNEEHLKQLLNYSQTKEDNTDRLLELSQQASLKTGINNIAITVRKTITAHETSVYASYYNGKDFALSPKYELNVVDRVGSGDAFSAGIVYSFTQNYTPFEAVGFSIASCAIKHTINNDINLSSINEIKSIMKKTNSDVVR